MQIDPTVIVKYIIRMGLPLKTGGQTKPQKKCSINIKQINKDTLFTQSCDLFESKLLYNSMW